MQDALRLAFVWLLMLIALPLGSARLEPQAAADSCASWCPCEDELAAATHDDGACEQGEDCTDCGEAEDCDEGCSEACDGCCDARVPVALSAAQPAPAPAIAALTDTPPAREAPGCRVDSSVFRPPRLPS